MLYRKLTMLALSGFVGMGALMQPIHSEEVLKSDNQSENSQDRAQVGERAMTAYERIIVAEKRALEAPAMESTQPSDAAALVQDGQANGEEKITSNAYSNGAYCNHPAAFHLPIARSWDGEYITIEDGSIWKIWAGDAYLDLNWFMTDTLVIIQDTSFFAVYPYRIVNQNTGASVAATLYAGPIYGNPYTLQIAAIDTFFNQVYLNDGSVFEISAFDDSCLVNGNLKYRWMVGDAVVLGSNDGNFALTRPFIIINVNVNDFARANRIR